MGNRAAKRSVPEVLTDPGRVAGAIERARQSAAERKVPLTMERVAACLEVEPWEIRAAIIQAKSSRGRKSSAQKKAGRELEAVCADCRAFLVEQGIIPFEQRGDADFLPADTFRLYRPTGREGNRSSRRLF